MVDPLILELLRASPLFNLDPATFNDVERNRRAASLERLLVQKDGASEHRVARVRAVANG